MCFIQFQVLEYICMYTIDYIIYVCERQAHMYVWMDRWIVNNTDDTDM